MTTWAWIGVGASGALIVGYGVVAAASVRRLRLRRPAHPFTPAARRRYIGSWSELQATSAENPQVAATRADGLVAELLRDRGYPPDDFDAQIRRVGIEHPEVVEGFERAHRIVHDRHREQRALFARLLPAGDPRLPATLRCTDERRHVLTEPRSIEPTSRADGPVGLQEALTIDRPVRFR